MRMSIAGGACALACTVWGAGAGAQDSRAELARRDLIQRAETARRAGHFEEALESASRAAQIRQTPSLRLLLAQAHGELGHVLEALEQARACVREAEADASLRNRELVRSGCQEVAERMEPRVGRLTVRMAPTLPAGVAVRVGDGELNAALLGVPVPTMPGSVTVRAEAAGYRPYEETLQIRPGESGELVVNMEREPVVAIASPPPRASGAAEARRGPGAGPWVVLGVGVAASVTGGVMLGLAESERQTRDRATAQGPAEAADASFRTYAYIGDVLLGLGVAGVVGGVLWRVLARDQGEGPGHATPRVALSPTAGGATISLGGSL